jgi:mannose-1-phosphate guanylyltransferase
VNDRPLLINTVDRLRELVPLSNILILTNASLAQAVATALPDIPADNIVAEPKPAGTAAALTWAAREIEKQTGPDSTMVCVHADWAIADDNGFRQALDAAMRVAAEE